jgi:hypothetical protein
MLIAAGTQAALTEQAKLMCRAKCLAELQPLTWSGNFLLFTVMQEPW